MINYLKKEKVLTISLVLAVISAFFIHPDKQYAEYVDVRVLALLFCLMLLVKGFQDIGLFNVLIQKVFGGIKTCRVLIQMLILLNFFLSMLITNDVALITFVPFGILALRLCHQEKWMIQTVVLETIAANLGSMLTPIGNPQNLYLFSASNMPLGEFFATMLPLAILSLVLLMAATVFIPNEKIAMEMEKNSEKMNLQELVIYGLLFAVNLLVVFRVISFVPALIITVVVVMLMRKWKLFAKVDYALLLTFVGFFIFVGNMGRIPAVSRLLEMLIQGRELLTAALFSQFLSNVPAALLLSGFTDNFQALLVGTNVGGLGTLIASMASLISYKLYGAQEDAEKGKYFRVFTVYNVIGFVILLIFAMIIY